LAVAATVRETPALVKEGGNRRVARHPMHENSQFRERPAGAALRILRRIDERINEETMPRLGRRLDPVYLPLTHEGEASAGTVHQMRPQSEASLRSDDPPIRQPT
jgi:hypothetical protein